MDIVRQKKLKPARRRLIGAAAVALSAPMVATAKTGPIVLRWQSTWSSKDPFDDYASDFARRVNAMAAGELRIDVLPAGAVAPAAGLLDAVSKGNLDGGHGMLAHHFHRQSALGLWGSGPSFGMDANMMLAWHRHGGGKELLARLYESIGANVVSFLYGPMPTQPLGWFRRPVARAEDLRGQKFRSDGVAADLFTAMGAVVDPLAPEAAVAAMSKGLLDAAEFNNASSANALGIADVSKVCMLQSYHQNAEQFEILFNRTRYESLPARLKAIIDNAVEAASAAMSWQAIERYSRDYISLQSKGVRFFRTPDAVLQQQLASYDEVAKKRAEGNTLFGEIQASQRRFAERAVRWELDTVVERRSAFDHYFPASGSARKPGNV